MDAEQRRTANWHRRLRAMCSRYTVYKHCAELCLSSPICARLLSTVPIRRVRVRSTEYSVYCMESTECSVLVHIGRFPHAIYRYRPRDSDAYRCRPLSCRTRLGHTEYSVGPMTYYQYLSGTGRSRTALRTRGDGYCRSTSPFHARLDLIAGKTAQQPRRICTYHPVCPRPY